MDLKHVARCPCDWAVYCQQKAIKYCNLEVSISDNLSISVCMIWEVMEELMKVEEPVSDRPFVMVL
jgi:hypothetical protein